MEGWTVSVERGGKRAGAGRRAAPAGVKRIAYPLRVQPWVREWLLAQGGEGPRMIEEALREVYGMREEVDERAGGGGELA